MESNSNSESLHITVRTPTSKKFGRNWNENFDQRKRNLNDTRAKYHEWDDVYRNSDSSPSSRNHADKERRIAADQIDASDHEIKAEGRSYAEALHVEASNMALSANNETPSHTSADPSVPLTGSSPLVKHVLKSAYLSNPSRVIPWFEVHEQPREGRKSFMRTRVSKYYNRFRHFSQAQCMITGEWQTDNVKAAHIIPACAHASLFQSLQIPNGRNDARNYLLLCSNIEKAFDRNQIMLLPSSTRGGDWYEMHLLDPSIEDDPTFEGSPTTIGDHVEKPFKLAFRKNRTTRKPWSRALQYHAHCSHAVAKCNRWIDRSNEFPPKFGTPVKNNPIVKIWELSADPGWKHR